MSAADRAGLEPIVARLRVERPRGETLVVRGGPLSVEKFVEHATRQARAYSYGDKPMFSISVDATEGTWALDGILRDRLWSRSTYAVCQVGTLHLAGFVLLPTHGVPHHDVLLPDGRPETAATLLALFGAAEINPFKRARR